MHRIVPCLWFNNEAGEAVNLYSSCFANSKTLNTSRYSEGSPRPKGTVMTVAFQLAGQEFTALNGGPEFKFSQAVSFFVGCETAAELDDLWHKLSAGGSVMMELGKYPFAERYGWLQDRFGVSWQLMLGRQEQKIEPALLFVGEQYGRADEALSYYASVFPGSRIKTISRYAAGQGQPQSAVAHAVVSLSGQDFVVTESAMSHQFAFNEAISFVVNCETQDEVDLFWRRLTERGQEVQCGWLKDRFGVSWQVVPTILGVLLADPDPVKAGRVMQAMLPMKKIDIAGLKRAYEGK
jgi:predicted 3-demethylubiquinone-9 3-methyltransferase (glyoxalase superfamily)